ncbi:Conserved_hypothetical protein [Hexamita inflata]|uniref:Uncharacterized protein n=1 Tax=Hexamita inflata TaxID=28002 RepID=A0AA86NIK8_9EUKA|nr:Conserved hypothetical protein [Hexamita inflata]CAI9946564.1 Conserved hypothetical protein [Hexamita inflata]CAI9947665.1 Conserved hypothetical protein [Hexamita inflata]
MKAPNSAAQLVQLIGHFRRDSQIQAINSFKLYGEQLLQAEMNGETKQMQEKALQVSEKTKIMYDTMLDQFNWLCIVAPEFKIDATTAFENLTQEFGDCTFVHDQNSQLTYLRADPEPYKLLSEILVGLNNTDVLTGKRDKKNIEIRNEIQKIYLNEECALCDSENEPHLLCDQIIKLEKEIIQQKEINEAARLQMLQEEQNYELFKQQNASVSQQQIDELIEKIVTENSYHIRDQIIQDMQQKLEKIQPKQGKQQSESEQVQQLERLKSELNVNIDVNNVIGQLTVFLESVVPSKQSDLPQIEGAPVTLVNNLKLSQEKFKSLDLKLRQILSRIESPTDSVSEILSSARSELDDFQQKLLLLNGFNSQHVISSLINKFSTSPKELNTSQLQDLIKNARITDTSKFSQIVQQINEQISLYQIQPVQLPIVPTNTKQQFSLLNDLLNAQINAEQLQNQFEQRLNLKEAQKNETQNAKIIQKIKDLDERKLCNVCWKRKFEYLHQESGQPVCADCREQDQIDLYIKAIL